MSASVMAAVELGFTMRSVMRGGIAAAAEAFVGAETFVATAAADIAAAGEDRSDGGLLIFHA